jgi:hypothetical protein
VNDIAEPFRLAVLTASSVRESWSAAPRGGCVKSDKVREGGAGAPPMNRDGSRLPFREPKIVITLSALDASVYASGRRMLGRWLSLSLLALLLASGAAEAAPKAKGKAPAATAKGKKGKEPEKPKEEEKDKEKETEKEQAAGADATAAAEEAKSAAKEDAVKSAGTTTPKQTDAANVKVKEDKEGVKSYKFDTIEVEGRLKSPQVIYFLRRVRAEFEAGALGHRSFLGELSDSRRSAAFR